MKTYRRFWARRDRDSTAALRRLVLDLLSDDSAPEEMSKPARPVDTGKQFHSFDKEI